jgi:hypothetical protein
MSPERFRMTPDLVKVYCALFAALGVSFTAFEWGVRVAAPLVVIAYTIWKWRREAKAGRKP